jgi:hypothetical protein
MGHRSDYGTQVGLGTDFGLGDGLYAVGRAPVPLACCHLTDDAHQAGDSPSLIAM